MSALPYETEDVSVRKPIQCDRCHGDCDANDAVTDGTFAWCGPCFATFGSVVNGWPVMPDPDGEPLIRRGTVAVAVAVALIVGVTAHWWNPTAHRTDVTLMPAAPVTSPAPVIYEDDPRWDCRTMGNHLCGVSILGAWYLISFDQQGRPMGVRQR